MTTAVRADRIRVCDRRTVRALVALAVVATVFLFALPKVAGFSEVWTQIRGMSLGTIVALGAAAAWNLVTYAFVLRAATPGLTYPQAVVVTESSTAVANAVPGGGAIGVGVTAAMYRSWGFGPSSTSLAIVLTGIWNNLMKLGLPILALALLAVQGDASVARLTASFAGVAALAAVIAGIVFVLHNDAMARRTGVVTSRCVSSMRRLVRRPGVDTWVDTWADAASELRVRSLELLRATWLRLTVATVVTQLSLYLVLLLTVRGVGVSSASVSWIEVLAAFAFVRLLSALPITPGGLGVVELGLTAALVGAGGSRPRVVAAVLVFRALTYLAPIVVGMATYVVWRQREAWRTPVAAAAA